MSQPNFDKPGARSITMSQDEANEVMQLWAEIQREEAARQALITVHDVAETIQVSPDQVARLLLEVRQRDKQFQAKDRPAKVRGRIPDSTVALSGAVSLILGLILIPLGEKGPLLNFLMATSLMWTVFLTIYFAANAIVRALGYRIDVIALKRLEARNITRQEF